MTLLAARDPRAPIDFGWPGIALDRRPRGHDWLLTAIALVLALLGALLVWAATRDPQRAAGADPNSFLYRHLLNIVIAAGLMVAASRVDTRFLRVFALVVYAGSLVGLLATFVIGTTVNGARAWISVGGGFELQPAEFMKLGMIVGMAVLFPELAERRLRSERVAERRLRSERTTGPGDDEVPRSADVLLAIGLLVVPLGLILLQPDLGSAMVLAVAALGVLVVARVRARWIFGLVLLAVVAAVLVVKSGMLADYQVQRLLTFTDPTRDAQGAAYNVTQAHIAIANGGLFGTGLFHGPQTNGGFVPEQQTDFVFSVAGEEFGLVGGGVLIALFGLLCWRGLRIAREAQGAGRLLVIGIVCWFGFQAFENIGMNLGLMPVTGLPLPFVSYGGSSMFAEALAIGLIQAVRRGPASDRPASRRGWRPRP